jgi:hypothetical protein
MKLSNETLTVLKNFASINSGIEFKTGNKIATISSTKTVLAKATLKDDFPQDFCVYDLNQFLSVHSLYKDSELDFDTSNIIFKSGRSKIKYRMTAKNMIVTAPDKDIPLSNPEVEFTLKEEDLANALKSAAVLQSPNIAVESDGTKIYVSTFNAKDDASHTNSIEVGDGNGSVFKAVFLTENLKMIPGSYEVKIYSKGLASFSHAVEELDYFIAIEAKESNFGG